MVATSQEVAWQPLFQQSIDAYYAGDLAGGRAACERLLSLEGLPPDVREQVRRNAVFYAPQLATWISG
ncbi:MAG TPA: hypothetical protein VFQ80_14350, partial [Thermomicrobiales bacterium]|nr:hypothetical protein [Thermomicrobiales bacterium]